MTIRAHIGLEYPTVLSPANELSGFEGWGVRIG